MFRKLALAAMLTAAIATPASAHGGFWPGFAAGAITSLFVPPIYGPPVVYAPPPVVYNPPVYYYPPGAPTVFVPGPAIPDPAIRFAQHGLNIIMGAGLNEDGVIGPATYSAICEFQARNGLVVDGIAGTATLAVIEHQLRAFAPPSPPVAKEPPADKSPS